MAESVSKPHYPLVEKDLSVIDKKKVGKKTAVIGKRQSSAVERESPEIKKGRSQVVESQCIKDDPLYTLLSK